ncbi:MAG: REP-associated tyrosine transposase [Chloroflexota bacterium]
MPYKYRRLTTQERKIVIQERLERGFPPHSPPHLAGDDGYYFVSAACFNHQPLMASPHRRLALLHSLSAGFDERGVELRAWAILPNHYHVLIRSDAIRLLGEALRQVHGAVSRKWNLEDGRLGRKVWYRYTDRAIRSEAHYCATLNYVHYNPVKHGWTGSAYDWEASSIEWYAKHQGKEWLRDIWRRFPVNQFGKGWDDEF